MVGDKSNGAEEDKKEDVSRIVAASEVKGTVVPTTMTITTTTATTTTTTTTSNLTRKNYEKGKLESEVVGAVDPTSAFDVANQCSSNNIFPMSLSSSSLSSTSTDVYCGQPIVSPWHSPHVGPVGSEI